MAMIECVECKQQRSSEAKACPHCGYKIKSSMGGGFWFGLICFVFVIVGLMSMYSQPTSSDSAATLSTEEIMREEQTRLAEQCKNGYQSACDTEREHTQLMNAAGIY